MGYKKLFPGSCGWVLAFIIQNSGSPEIKTLSPYTNYPDRFFIVPFRVHI
jgi:hypothetical protein